MNKSEYEYLRRRLAEKFNTKHYAFYPEREEGYKHEILDAEFVLKSVYREWEEFQDEAEDKTENKNQDTYDIEAEPQANWIYIMIDQYKCSNFGYITKSDDYNDKPSDTRCKFCGALMSSEVQFWHQNVNERE